MNAAKLILPALAFSLLTSCDVSDSNRPPEQAYLNPETGREWRYAEWMDSAGRRVITEDTVSVTVSSVENGIEKGVIAVLYFGGLSVSGITGHGYRLIDGKENH